MLGQYGATRWVEAKATSQDIPAFGIVEITGAELENPGRTVLQVSIPSEDSVLPFAINSWKPIPVGKYGLVACEGPVYGLYDSAATPVVGELRGPGASSFRAKKDALGLVVVGGVDSDLGIVLMNIASSSAKDGTNSVAITTEIIPGRVGFQAGGPIEVTRIYMSDTGLFTEGETVEVWSWIKSDSSDPADEPYGELWIFMEQDEYGHWMFTGQDCPSGLGE